MSRNLRGRLDRLERRCGPRRVGFWDVLLGGADPAGLDGEGRRVWEEWQAIQAAPLPPNPDDEALRAVRALRTPATPEGVLKAVQGLPAPAPPDRTA